MASIPASLRPIAPASRLAPRRGSAPARTVFPRGRRRTTGRQPGLALLAIALALLLRLVPGEDMLALDRGVAVMATAAPTDDRTATDTPSTTGDTFPGSAYFLAQDAFGPLAPPSAQGDPAVTTVSDDQRSPHILQIENGPAALSMPTRGIGILDQARALQCMTNAIYYEAGNEPEEGQRAVAQVILNRMASGRWPTSVCGVIYQGTERADRLCQFTFSCDGSMARTPAAASWTRARRVAARALSGGIFAPAGLATFYHTLAVRPPWVDRVRPVAVIGAHIFYRMTGEAGAPASYRMRYSGRETAQPGPYAFARAPQTAPLLAPPGPEMLGAYMPAAVGMQAQAGFPPPTRPSQPLSFGSGPVPIAIPQASYGYTPSATAPAPPSAGSANLPQSTIRAEYRNSGRALR